MQKSNNISQIVDTKDEQLENVPFGKNKFLRAIGATLFGLTAQAMMGGVQKAKANHLPTSWPCYGFNSCHNCPSAGNCSVINTVGTGGCKSIYGPGYTSGWNCWYTFAAGHTYSCCDYLQYGTPCIQRTYYW